MKNLVLDFGNSRIKAGIFLGHELMESLLFTMESLNEFIRTSGDWDNCIVSSVSVSVQEILNTIPVAGKKIILTHQTSLPIKINYRTPETLGVDRIAAVCGALEIFPRQDCLVIDAGTCINYEFVDKSGVYLGGAIAPGIRMRFEAMHTFTAKLPLVMPVPSIDLIGVDTQTCMQSGVMNGVLAEVKEIISRYESSYPSLGVVLCGGDYAFFENKLKPSIFVAPDLVLRGLNRILLHNAA